MLHHETPTIYIDGGSNNINGIVASWQTNGVRLPHLPQYCFEPNPRYADGYKGNTTLITKAIWISDEVIPFYLSRDRGSFGSSIFGHKLTRIKRAGLAPVPNKPGYYFSPHHDDGGTKIWEADMSCLRGLENELRFHHA